MKEVNIVIISNLTSVIVLLICGGIVMHYYKVLKINKDANQNGIKQAYRKLAKEHHPDKGSEEKEEFQKVKEANDILSDKQSKDLYDKYLEYFNHEAFIEDRKIIGNNIEKLKTRLKMRLDSRSSGTPKDKSQSTNRDMRNQNLPIHQAIEQNRYKEALDLIKHAKPGDVNVKNKFGQTPLHLAIATQHLGPNLKESKRIDIVDALIRKEANVNAQDKDEETAVHYIIRWVINNGNDEKVKTWVCYNMNTNKVDIQDVTSILSSLVKHGADVNIKNNKGNTALSCVINSQYIISTGLYGSIFVEEQAWKEETWDIVKSLLKANAYIETQEAVFLMLETSIKVGFDLEMVKLVMSSSKIPFDVNYEYATNTIFWVALECSRFDIIEFLIEKGLDIKSEQNKESLISAMMYFVRCENAASLDILLTHPLLKEAINIDVRKEFVDGYYNVSMLEMAALKCNIPALEVLSRHKANANSRVIKSNGEKGCAILHRLAGEYNKKEDQTKKNQIKNVMELLVLLLNADLTLKDSEGKTPLDYLEDEDLKKCLKDVAELRENINKIYKDTATDFVLQHLEQNSDKSIEDYVKDLLENLNKLLNKDTSRASFFLNEPEVEAGSGTVRRQI